MSILLTLAGIYVPQFIKKRKLARLFAATAEGFGADMPDLAGKDAMQMAHLIYGIVGIDFRGNPQGEVVISRCYFSSFYSPKVCGIISSLDAGLLSGISGGGRLSFQQRLTEGTECCRARLSLGVRST